VPLVRRALDAALGAGLSPVCLVTGHDEGSVLAAAGPALRDGRLELARNPDPGAGMSASLRAGLDAVRGRADAVMILLADMPGVTAGLASAVLSAYASTAARVAAPVLEGRTGHPAILRSDLFAAVDALRGDVGARSVIEANLDRAATFPLTDPSSQTDVD
jgi:molybdenum cofactor cytidylyltransferase